MICILRANFVAKNTMNIIPKGTIMETVMISDQGIQLTDVMGKDRELDLKLETFTNEDLVEILEGGV